MAIDTGTRAFIVAARMASCITVALRDRLAGLPIYYGWIVSMLCLVAILAIYSINVSFGVFFDFIIQDMESGRATTSVVFSLQTLALYLSSALVGTQVERFGIRRLVLLGSILLATGMLGASRATSLLGLGLSYGVVAGTGMGIVYVIAYTLPPRWFERRRGTATAIATSGTGLATMLAPPAAAALVAVAGWQKTYLLFTAAALVGLVFVAVLAGRDPWTMGLEAAHEFPDGSPTDAESTAGGQPSASVRATVKSRSFVLVVASWALIYVPFFTLLVHFVAYTTDVGMGRWVGVVGVSLVGGLSIPGRLVFGSVGDRLGRPATFVALSLCMGVSLLVLSLVTNPMIVLAMAAIYGVVHGGNSALLTPLLADMYGTAQVTELYGVAALGFAASAILGPYLAGVTVETLGSYTPFFVLSSVLVIVGGGGIHLASIREDLDSRLQVPLGWGERG
jgi:MFS family permease